MDDADDILSCIDRIHSKYSVKSRKPHNKNLIKSSSGSDSFSAEVFAATNNQNITTKISNIRSKPPPIPVKNNSLPGNSLYNKIDLYQNPQETKQQHHKNKQKSNSCSEQSKPETPTCETAFSTCKSAFSRNESGLGSSRRKAPPPPPQAAATGLSDSSSNSPQPFMKQNSSHNLRNSNQSSNPNSRSNSPHVNRFRIAPPKPAFPLKMAKKLDLKSGNVELKSSVDVETISSSSGHSTAGFSSTQERFRFEPISDLPFPEKFDKNMKKTRISVFQQLYDTNFNSFNESTMASGFNVVNL